MNPGDDARASRSDPEPWSDEEGTRPPAADTSEGLPAEEPSAELAALADLYRRVDQLLAERRPRCELSGRCCNFDAQEHQLWASQLELDYALDAAGGEVPEAPSGSCPWWRSGLCTLREGRPLGCRLYFCDSDWADEMGSVYEHFHRQLREVHREHGRPYSYQLFVDAVARAPSVETPPS